MAFPKMGVSKESLEGMKPVPGGVYEVKLDGFDQKLSKNKDSINFNPILKVVNHPHYNGQRIFANLNSKAGWILQDFAHSFGLPMEMEGDEAMLPGGSKAWVPKNPADKDSDDVEKFKYVGPLVGKTAKVEVIEVRKQGQKPRNEIKQFLCKITDCATKFPDISHSTNLIK